METLPNTKHVREVLAAAERYGLRQTAANNIGRGRVRVEFVGDTGSLSVTFDKRGYIRSAGGTNRGRGGNWVIDVSSSNRFPVTPARALDVLVNFTLPEYA